ncbi:hypothetical protein L0F63_002088 [Massospora cicadina]|nr:hypothetical protein L0F63_002088 [Massospora cicadina]
MCLSWSWASRHDLRHPTRTDGGQFRIIDKRTEATFYSRAFIIHSRTQEIFQQLGVLNTISSKGRVDTLRVQLYYNGKALSEFGFPPSESSCPYTVGLVQSETEKVLLERLAELGFEVEKGIELRSLNFNNGQVEAKSALVSSLADGAQETIKGTCSRVPLFEGEKEPSEETFFSIVKENMAPLEIKIKATYSFVEMQLMYTHLLGGRG